MLIMQQFLRPFHGSVYHNILICKRLSFFSNVHHAIRKSYYDKLSPLIDDYLTTNY